MKQQKRSRHETPASYHKLPDLSCKRKHPSWGSRCGVVVEGSDATGLSGARASPVHRAGSLQGSVDGLWLRNQLPSSWQLICLSGPAGHERASCVLISSQLQRPRGGCDWTAQPTVPQSVCPSVAPDRGDYVGPLSSETFAPYHLGLGWRGSCLHLTSDQSAACGRGSRSPTGINGSSGGRCAGESSS